MRANDLIDIKIKSKKNIIYNMIISQIFIFIKKNSKFYYLEFFLLYIYYLVIIALHYFKIFSVVFFRFFI